MLEQLARDVTGSNARVVEYFRLLATTQYLNHTRPDNVAVADLRRGEPLQRLGSAFETTARTAEVRRIGSGRGRYGIQNIGIFLWPVQAVALTRSPARAVDDRRLLFSPLGQPVALLTAAETEDEITHLAAPINVPARISRRILATYLAHYYGPGKSLLIHRGGHAVPIDDVLVCDLRDHAGGWAHVPPPAGVVAVDPELGRVALGTPLSVGETLEVSFHYGFPADLGGGEYPREHAAAAAPAGGLVRVPDDHPTIAAAVFALGHAGVVEITDSGRHEVEGLHLRVPAGETLEIRAANRRRPLLVLHDEIGIAGGRDSAIVLDGLLIGGNRLDVPADPDNRLARLAIRHCTLVPGWSLDADGGPGHSGEPSLVAAIADLAIEIERSIVGPLRVHRQASATMRDCIVDAMDRAAVAYGGSSPGTVGATLSADASTVIGEVHTRAVGLASNCIFLSRVVAVRKQTGCIRFCYLPADSHVPRRYRCQPGDAASARIAPGFVSLRYGDARYAQLARTTAPGILRGADDEGEMGAFHHLHWPQREANLRLRLQEYLRVGLEAGIFYEF
jgi:hypothetical protein